MLALNMSVYYKLKIILMDSYYIVDILDHFYALKSILQHTRNEKDAYMEVYEQVLPLPWTLII